MRHYNIPIFVPHAGCLFDCVFCNQKHITGQNATLEPALVEAQIESFLESIYANDSEKFIEIAFFGGSFTGIPIQEQEALLAIAYKYKESGQIDGIRLSTRPDYIDEKVLALLSRYGVTTVELGVQSLDQGVLDLARRGHTLRDVVYASNLIKAAGFRLGLQMMIGLPGDTVKKVLRTTNQLIQLSPDCVRVYPTLVVQDTELERMYREGTYEPLTIDEAVEITAFVIEKFNKHDIPVIRIGLQPTDELSDGAVIAGPYHPAFRQLVESKLYLDAIFDRLEGESIESLIIYTHPKELSNVVGQKRANLELIESHFGIDKVIVKPEEMELGLVKLIVDGETIMVRK